MPKKRQRGKQSEACQVEEIYLDMDQDMFVDAESDFKKVCECPGFTGMFYDGLRRADYVLVILRNDDPKTYPSKKKFLLGIIRLGLQLEFTKGQLMKRENMLFVKIFAPDQVLDDFAQPLAQKKFFKDTHLRHMGGYQTGDEILFSQPRERAWLKMCRLNYKEPLLMSNHERSMIVYLILRKFILDTHDNHLDLQRLVNRGIILDAFALHDGPYFFVDGQQMEKCTTRQMLNYNWVGAENSFGYQPKHLIHEYFGPKIAFYFTFYEFYNKFLFILSLIGIVTYVLQVNLGKNDQFDQRDRRAKTCDNVHKMTVCSECSNWTLCPMYKMHHYCATLTWTSFFDNTYTVAYCMLIVPWAILFYVCWRRQEMFHIWFWELNLCTIDNPTLILRPEYVGASDKAQGCYEDEQSKYGHWSNDQSPLTRIIRYSAGALLAIMVLLAAYVCYHIYFFLHLKWPGLYQVKDYKWKGDYVITGDRKILAFLTTGFYLLMFFLEWLARIVAQEMVMVENHRTHSAHERRTAVAMFSLACITCFPLPVLFGWLKGTFYVYPRNMEWEIMNTTCGAWWSCLDQLMLITFILCMLRIVLMKALQFCAFGWKTDFSMNVKLIGLLPSWEREYGLPAIKEIHMCSYFNEIVVQFAIIVFLSPWFPLMPAIAFLVNWYDIKHKAKVFVRHRRRPTLYPCDGIMHWNTILRGIIIIIPIVHGITLARNLRIGLLPILTVVGDYQYKWNQLFYHSEFNLNKLGDKMFDFRVYVANDQCSFDGSYYQKISSVPNEFPFQLKMFKDHHTSHSAKNQTYYTMKHNLQFIRIYSQWGIAFILVVLYFVPQEISWVLRCMQMEKTLKRLFVMSSIKIPNDQILLLVVKRQYEI